MRCSDIEELLSAYANGELSRIQSDFVEEHISNCADCRKNLEDFIDTRRQLAYLREMPVLQDIKATTMSEIKAVDIRRSARKWLRPTLVAVPIVVIAAILITWQPWSSFFGAQSVMAKAQAAISNLQSYRFSLESSNTKGETSEVHLDFSSPDRYHVTKTEDGDNQEFILIGDKQYFKDKDTSQLLVDARAKAYSSFSSMLTREATIKLLNYLTDIQKLPHEIVDGTVCLHYKGTLDYEKQLREQWLSQQAAGMFPISDEQMEEMLEKMRTEGGTTTIELWIGKNDHLIRKMKEDNQRPDGNGGVQSSIFSVMFYDFDKPVSIKAPVDSQGDLLSGWFSTSPKFPHFSTNTQVEVDNYNPSERKVDFSIDVTNISTELINGINVGIASIFPTPFDNYVYKIWFRWENGQQFTSGPYSMNPNESLKYSCTFGYDATFVSPEIISKMIEDSYVRLNYLDNEGQNKVEIFHFEAPESIYTLSTDIPPHLIPIELKVSGEYRIKESGATFAGGCVTGEINGKEYMFVVTNIAEAEAPASPGILVLDIQNKSKPQKVAYLNIIGVTNIFSRLALHDTFLYVSTDDSLWVIDVSDPAKPRELSRLPGFKVNQMVISGEYAFINEENNNIVTLDISDPANPKKIGTLAFDNPSGFEMEIYGNYLLAEISNTLYVIDASMPSELKIVGEHAFSGPINEENPVLIYPYHIMGWEIKSSYVYVTASTQGALAVGVSDISEPTNPREVTFLRLKDRSFNGPLFVSGKRVYIFTRKSSGMDRRQRLEILDITNPAEPVELGYGIMPDALSFFDKSYSSSTQSYNLIGNYLYWFIGNSPNLPVIEIFDLRGL